MKRTIATFLAVTLAEVRQPCHKIAISEYFLGGLGGLI
jgi:hypothetical protein